MTEERYAWDADGRLAFAVDLAEAKLSKLRPGDISNLKDDLRTFLAPGLPAEDWGGVLITSWVEPNHVTDDDLRSIQLEVRKLLRDSLRERDEPSQEPPTPTKLQLHVRLVYDPDGRSYEELVTASVRDRFLYVLVRLLGQQGLSQKIRSCPVCKRGFVRVRRQKYCSRQCTNYANKQAYLERHGLAGGSKRGSRSNGKKK